jgi:capsular exopolysaccharide synthesis family protein
VAAQNDRSPDARRYLRVVWRRKWLLLAVFLLIPAGAYFVTSRAQKVYEASAVVQIRPTNVSSSVIRNQPLIGVSGVAEAARLIETTDVARLAAKELGDPPEQAGSLVDAINVGTEDEFETGFLTIRAQSGSPERAAAVANAFAAAISDSRTQEAIDAVNDTIATLADQLERAGANDPARDTLSEQIQQLQALRGGQSGATEIIEPAVPPAAPIAPRPGRATVVAGVLGLLVAAMLVPLLEALDRRLRESEDLEELDIAPLLSWIPVAAFPGNVPGPPVREAFQTLRAGLMYFNIDRTLTSVMVTSPGLGDGKTTVATNLAVALARDEQRVIIVDGDLHRPQVASRLGVADQVPYGLDAVLVDRRPLKEALVKVDAGAGQLRVLAGGVNPSASVILGSKQMRAMLAKLSEVSDIVILDTPPLLTVSDAIPLVGQVSGTLLVARLDFTKGNELARAGQVVSNASGNVIGLVATGVRAGGLPGRGRDHYGYGYGYGHEADGDAAG